MPKAIALVLHWRRLRRLPGEGDEVVTDRKPYETDEPQPEIHYEITVNGKSLCRNQECTLERGIGYPAGRYRFSYAECRPDGSWCLVFMRRDRRPNKDGEYEWRFRHVWRNAEAVRVIHRPRPEPDPA